jgi:hypothetical protein
MFANALLMLFPFSAVAKAPQRTSVNAQTQASERDILIDKLCESAGTRYRDLAKYRALSQKVQRN